MPIQVALESCSLVAGEWGLEEVRGSPSAPPRINSAKAHWFSSEVPAEMIEQEMKQLRAKREAR
jgi:hypothetical protein